MLSRFLSIAVSFWLLVGESQAFTTTPLALSAAAATTTTTTLQMTQPQPQQDESRRNFFFSTVATGAAILGSGVLAPDAAQAISGTSKVDAKLRGFGLPPVGEVPDGFTPLLEVYGKGKNRFPILVTFSHPITWVVTKPSNDANGEDGTIQVGEYAKGDTATFFVYSDPGHIDDIASQPKELFEKALIKAISQKGDSMYQNFKIKKLAPVTVDGQTYVLADFSYQLLTGAGFEVDRKAVASITSQGPAVEVLWAASTAIRYKKTEQDLRKIVGSFRCYTDGLNFSNELAREYE